MSLFWIGIIFCLLVMTYGLNRVLTGAQEVGQTAQKVISQGQKLSESAQNLKEQTDQIQNTSDHSELPTTVVPRGSSESEESQVGGDNGNGTLGSSGVKKNDGIVVGSVGEQLSDTRVGSGQAVGNLGVPLGAPVRSFVEFGEVASAHPKDIWLDNVALTIPPSNVGTTDIVFVDASRPQQCYQKCKNSPFCRFFSYWKETGVCNMHQTLQNGETSPENMIRYAYTVPFSQHWVSGYVRKSGDLVPPSQL